MFYPSTVLTLCITLTGVTLGYLFLRPADEHPAHRMRLARDVALLAVLLGALLRFYALDFGLPDSYHPDEARKAHNLAKMMAEGTIFPKSFLHPPLLVYLTWMMRDVILKLGIGEQQTIVRILLAGRIVSALLGTLSIWLVYLIGKRAFSPLAGALAALLLAVSPLHVTCSRYLKEDVLVTTLMLASVVFLFRALQKKELRPFYLAALFAGMATGAKYNALVMMGFIAITPWLASGTMRPDRRLLKHVIPALLIVTLGFIIVAPTVVLQPERFLRGFTIESQHALRGHLGAKIDAWSQLFMFHLSKSLMPGLHWIPAMLGILGAGVSLKRRKPLDIALLLLFAAFYFPAEMAKSKPFPQPDRYVLPCIPILAMLAAEGTESLLAALRANRHFIFHWAAMLALVTFPLMRTLDLAAEIEPDTRAQMQTWVRHNIPRESKIVLVGGTVYLPRLPTVYKVGKLRDVNSDESRDLIDNLRRSDYEYLLLSRWSDPRFINLGAKREALQAIESNFVLIKRIAPKNGPYGFHNPTLSLYSLKMKPGGDPAISLGGQVVPGLQR